MLTEYSGRIISNLFNSSSEQFQVLSGTWIIVFAAVVLLCFIVSEITGNYSQVDKLWSLEPIIYGWITYSFMPSPRIALMAILATIWGLRLSYNFARKGGYNIIPWKGEEDYRWQVMRDQPVLKGRLRFGLFNLLFVSFYQQFLILLFSSPLLIAALYPEAALGIIDFIAASLIILFIIIESIADNQRFRFHTEKKKRPEDWTIYRESLRKGFMTEGIWRYSRHPNFASEQAIWICFYFFSVAASGEWLNIAVTGSVLLVLLFIGSTLLTENLSLKKYPEYALYQKEVPKFIPSILKKRRKD
jgi:steroid 5-alpha reductase family enzyme